MKMLTELKTWVELEIEEIEELIDPFNPDYERLLGSLNTLNKFLNKIKEVREGVKQ